MQTERVREKEGKQLRHGKEREKKAHTPAIHVSEGPKQGEQTNIKNERKLTFAQIEQKMCSTTMHNENN